MYFRQLTPLKELACDVDHHHMQQHSCCSYTSPLKSEGLGEIIQAKRIEAWIWSDKNSDVGQYGVSSNNQEGFSAQQGLTKFSGVHGEAEQGNQQLQICPKPCCGRDWILQRSREHNLHGPAARL